MRLSPSPRLRRSPYHDQTVADGATGFTVYNRMLSAAGFGDPDAAYRRLTEGVAMWDVASQRQVEVAGPDAARLVQALVPRKVAGMAVGQGLYVPLCDHRGVLLNDSVLLRLAEDRFWFSIADSDILLWVRAVAGERRMEVSVTEPDVSPLAVQGPRAEDVVAALFDDSIRGMDQFRFREIELDGIPLVLCRSGWSHQGGFELFLQNSARGDDLWRRVREAGRPFGIGPGTPSDAERIESGLLSWGEDCDAETNPYEVRLGEHVDLDVPDDTIGIKALRRLQERGPKRHQVGVVLDALDEDDGPLGPLDFDGRWAQVWKGATMAGHMTAAAWSPRLQVNIGVCLAWTGVGPGDDVRVILADGTGLRGEIRDLPFL